jgi:hypothetical protein
MVAGAPVLSLSIIGASPAQAALNYNTGIAGVITRGWGMMIQICQLSPGTAGFILSQGILAAGSPRNIAQKDTGASTDYRESL